VQFVNCNFAHFMQEILNRWGEFSIANEPAKFGQLRTG
jgi:hypothetical protein